MRLIITMLYWLIGIEPAPELGPVTVVCIHRRVFLMFCTGDQCHIYHYDMHRWLEVQTEIYKLVDANQLSFADGLRVIQITEDSMDQYLQQGSYKTCSYEP
jgi:hypothetical protein